MIVSKTATAVLFITPFDENFNLVQRFRNIGNDMRSYNGPIDFMDSGLIRKDQRDIWHMDVFFASNTDEATPCHINGRYIGANHQCDCAVSVYAPNHGKTLADVGSLWVDEKGIKFTLLDIEEDKLVFLSENVGESQELYKFSSVTGELSYVENGENTSSIRYERQTVGFVSRSIRHKRKRIVGYVNGKEFYVYGGLECDYAEIQEEYEILNPATQSEGLRKARPKGGFTEKPNFAEFGDGMLSYKMTYRIMPDGCVLCIFDVKKLSDVRLDHFMGAMVQEKIDVYGGGIWRYLPKTKPFTTPEGVFDFSNRISLAQKEFPVRYAMTKKDWTDELSPPDRFIDYFKDGQGVDKLGFACGYLPILDGEPSIRRERIETSMVVVNTRKAYPFFMSGDVSDCKGVAYKKYFLPQENGESVYIVPFENKKYAFMDFFKGKTLRLSVKGKVKILEKSGNVNYTIENNQIVATAEHGYAVFEIEEEK